MKLIKICANKPFKQILFNPGFNIILGEPKERKNDDKHTHNLGKSLLVEVLDFLMLKGLSTNHVFKKHKDFFTGYEFFLEILLNSGQHLIIGRAVDTPSKISFKILNSVSSEFYDNHDSIDWDVEKLSFEKAVLQLNTYLGFDVAAAYKYRKSITYFLRSQKDYLDVFQLSKFNKGRNMDWKPFLFEILGFPGAVLEEKYNKEKELDDLEQTIQSLKKEFAVSTEEADKIRGILEVKTEEKVTVEAEIDKFNFYLEDKELNHQLVEQIDSEISKLNTIRYNATDEMNRLKQNLKTDIPNVDISGLKELYEEVRIVFPQYLAKDYRELETFNKKVSRERKQYMTKRLEELDKELAVLETELKSLDNRKSDMLAVLKDKDSYQKFKHYQKELSKIEGELIRYEEKIQKIDRLGELEQQIESIKGHLKEQTEKIKNLIKDYSTIYKEIRHNFNYIVKSLLKSPAIISTSLNKSGNVDFHADIQNPEIMEKTAEGQGTTFKKLLCIAFDLSVLIVYSKRSFYKFVYHDGALETLDDRVKRKFLDIVRDICSQYDLQYILTVIDSDIPLDITGNRIVLPGNEIILKLHDQDDSGRLFEMSF